MLYYLALFFITSFLPQAFTAQPVDAKKDAIASIVVLRGKDVSVYSGNKKLKLTTKEVPYPIYSGDEVEAGIDSDCELIMYNKDSLYVSPETLFSLSWYRDELSTLWIKYGALMYRGANAIAVKSNDFSAVTSKGDFIIRYKRKTSESLLFNLGEEVKFKQGDIAATYVLGQNKYVKTIAFSGKKVIGAIDTKLVPRVYKLFSTSFKPGGKIDDDKNVPGKASEDAKMNPAEEANIDHVKRAIGL